MKRESCESKLSEPHAKLVILVNKLMGEHERRYQNSKEQYEVKVCLFSKVIKILKLLQLAEYNLKSGSDPTMKKPRNPARQFNWTIEGILDFYD